MGSVAGRLFDILEGTPQGGRAGRWFALSMMTLILANVAAVATETVPGTEVYERAFTIFDTVSVILFTIEYVSRLAFCTRLPECRRPLAGRLQYALRLLNLVDLLAILPFYLPLILPMDLRFMRILRLFRMIRLLKLGRYSQAVSLFAAVMRAKKEELAITALLLVIAVLLSGSVMYYVEHEAQPENFSSIPASLWWATVSLTTVGYGDVYPKTVMGKILGSLLAVLGIATYAIPTGIIATGFSDALQHRKRTNRAPPRCPHCHKRLDGMDDEPPASEPDPAAGQQDLSCHSGVTRP